MRNRTNPVAAKAAKAGPSGLQSHWHRWSPCVWLSVIALWVTMSGCTQPSDPQSEPGTQSEPGSRGEPDPQGERATDSGDVGLDDLALPPSEVAGLLPVSGGTFAEQLAAGRAEFSSTSQSPQAGTDRWASDSIQTDAPMTDQQLAELNAQDAWLENLLIDEGQLSDQGLKAIVDLPNLSHLRLRQSPIGDLGLVEIAKLAKLRVLNLPQSQVTAGGLRALAKNTTLRSLRLGGDRLDSTAAQSLAELKTLTSLHLIDVPIDDAGLKVIMTLPNLQSLYIDGSEITQQGWDQLLEARPGLHLHVNQQHLDRDPHKHPHN